MLFLLMMMNLASAGLQVLWMWAACISSHTFQRTLRVSGCRGQRTLRKVTKLESNAKLEAGGGGHWEYQILQDRKKNWQIPKYCVKNRRNTDTAFIFGHAYLKVYASRVIVYLKHLWTSNKPQRLRGKVRRPRIQSVQRSKRMPYQFHRLSVRNCVIIYH